MMWQIIKKSGRKKGIRRSLNQWSPAARVSATTTTTTRIVAPAIASVSCLSIPRSLDYGLLVAREVNMYPHTHKYSRSDRNHRLRRDLQVLLFPVVEANNNKHMHTQTSSDSHTNAQAVHLFQWHAKTSALLKSRSWRKRATNHAGDHQHRLSLSLSLSHTRTTPSFPSRRKSRPKREAVNVLHC